MLSALRPWFAHLRTCLPSLIPSSCALCGASGNSAICDGCQKQFFGSRRTRCTQCAVPLPGIDADRATRCGDCLQQAPAFDATIVATDYAPPIDQLVLALKFGGRLALAPMFAAMLRDALLHEQRHEQGNGSVLPAQLAAVPLGTHRLAERGFNQALEIAKPLSRAIGVKLDPRLAVRLRDTQAQAMLHPDARHKNVRNAFSISEHALDRIRGQHIGVVDDVMTTGVTLNEMAATLKRFGAVRVTNYVFARTLPR